MITPLDFAARRLGQYKIHGDEIVPALCPICQGGQSGKDKGTFAMNVQTGAWNCKRGSCPGREGSFYELLRRFGEVPDRVAKYTPPKIKASPPAPSVAGYLKFRRISQATWEKYGVGDDGKGNIVFPFFENGEHVMNKIRPGRAIKDGESKMTREPGGKAVFWGMQLCDTSLPLVLTEGEIDCLTVAEAGIPNAISLPSGTQDLGCIAFSWDWLQQFDEVVLWVDTDTAGMECRKKLLQRIGIEKCTIVEVTGRKDANEVLTKDGVEAVLSAWRGRKPAPMDGLSWLVDVEDEEYSDTKRVLSGLSKLDTAMGGFAMGAVSLWTGQVGDGKSTLTNQIMLNAVDAGNVICIYSGELRKSTLKRWLEVQLAGPGYVEDYEDILSGKKFKRARPSVVEKIRSWYGPRICFYDSTTVSEGSSLLSIFQFAARRFGAKVFLVDNMMSLLGMSDGNEKNDNTRQKQLVTEICRFALAYDVHVHVVAHPRKPFIVRDKSGKGKPAPINMFDISGAQEIVNSVTNMFALRRVALEDQEAEGCDSILAIEKDREWGTRNAAIKLGYDDTCRRYNQVGEAPRVYGWDPQWDEIPF